MDTASVYPAKKKLGYFKLLLVLLGVLLVGGIAVYFYKPLTKKPTNSVPNPQTNVTTPVLSATVAISKQGFVPAAIEIKARTQLTWINKENSPHQIVSDPFPLQTNLKDLNSDPLLFNEAFSFTFEKPGTYTYHDQINSKLKGTVIVN